MCVSIYFVKIRLIFNGLQQTAITVLIWCINMYCAQNLGSRVNQIFNHFYKSSIQILAVIQLSCSFMDITKCGLPIGKLNIILDFIAGLQLQRWFSQYSFTYRQKYVIEICTFISLCWFTFTVVHTYASYLR